jgi:GT2 family glycosyltransferase
MKIIAIVITYNGSKWVEKCFKSLINSTIPLKVLAIDNCSTDGTSDLIKEKFPSVEVIEKSNNLGFGKANNIGLKKVLEEDADYAFLLNQDAWVENNTVEKLIEISKSNFNYGIISPIHFNGKGDNFDSGFLNYSTSTLEGTSFFFDLFMKHITSNTISTNFINAACWLIPKRTLEIVGGFNPVFPHYGEDFEFFRRLKKKHLIGVIAIDAKFYHDREDRTNQKKPLKKEVEFAYIHNYLLEISNPENSLIYLILFHLNQKIFNLIWAIVSFNRRFILHNLYFIIYILKNSRQTFKTRNQIKSPQNNCFLD